MPHTIKYSLFIITLLSPLCVQSQNNGGLSKQVQALKSAIQSYTEHTDNQILSLSNQLSEKMSRNELLSCEVCIQVVDQHATSNQSLGSEQCAKINDDWSDFSFDYDKYDPDGVRIKMQCP